jgi:hypothetical protein
MSQFPALEAGNTVQFTFVSSIAPDAAPIFKAINDGDTVVNCQTSIQSNATAFYALYTTPGSDQWMIGEWWAQKTVSGSARNFVKKFPFKVERTIVE